MRWDLVHADDPETSSVISKLRSLRGISKTLQTVTGMVFHGDNASRQLSPVRETFGGAWWIENPIYAAYG